MLSFHLQATDLHVELAQVMLFSPRRGATGTHVDGSKKAVGWARENAALADLSSAPVRWICDDARKYVQREVKRGSRSDCIILDPPKYGRWPAGEVWRLHSGGYR